MGRICRISPLFTRAGTGTVPCTRPGAVETGPLPTQIYVSTRGDGVAAKAGA